MVLVGNLDAQKQLYYRSSKTAYVVRFRDSGDKTDEDAIGEKLENLLHRLSA